MKRRKNVMLDALSHGIIKRRVVVNVMKNDDRASPTDVTDFDPPDNYEVVEEELHEEEGIILQEIQEERTEDNNESIFSSEEDTVDTEETNGGLSYREHLLTFLYSSSKEYDSDARIKRQLKMENIRFCSNISFKDILDFRQNTKRRYGILVAYLCTKCEATLESSTKICERCEIIPSAHKDERITTVVVSRIRPQLTESVKELEKWKLDHQSKLQKEMYEFSGSGERVIEGVTSLPLMVYTDGVTPKQNYRHSFWPVFIQVGTLPAVLRGSSRHVAIAATIAGSGMPSKKAWKIVTDWIFDELQSICNNPIVINEKTFIFDIRHLLMDADALTKLFGSCGYQSIDRGCCLCTTLPRRKPSASIWKRTRDVPDRTSDSALDDARNNINGFKGIKAWHKLGDPTKWRIDALHVFDEGIIDRMLNRFFKSKNPESLKFRVLTELDKSFKQTVFPVNSMFYSRSLKEYNSFNGHEKRTLFFYIFPILIHMVHAENQELSIVYAIFYIVIRWMASQRLNDQICETVVSILPVLGRSFDQMFNDEDFYQMKSHLFFVHVVKCLLQYGSPYDFSTAAFESLYREIKVLFNVHDTRSLPSSMILKWLYRREVDLQIQNLLEHGPSESFKRMMGELSGHKFKKSLLAARPKIDVRKNCYFCVRIDNVNKFVKVIQFEPDSQICTAVELGGQCLLDFMLEDLSDDDELQAIVLDLKSLGDFCYVSTGNKETVKFHSNEIVAPCALLNFNDLDYIVIVDFRWSSK